MKSYPEFLYVPGKPARAVALFLGVHISLEGSDYFRQTRISSKGTAGKSNLVRQRCLVVPKNESRNKLPFGLKLGTRPVGVGLRTA